jgi:hypothetical protein
LGFSGLSLCSGRSSDRLLVFCAPGRAVEGSWLPRSPPRSLVVAGLQTGAFCPSLTPQVLLSSHPLPHFSRSLQIHHYTSRMAIFSRKKEKPAWLDQTRDFCRTAGINIVGWGPHALVVEAKSPERSAEIARQLASLGFKVMEDANDAYAGLLTLSNDSDAIQAMVASRLATVDISRRPWQEQIEPLIWGLCAFFLFVGLDTNRPERYWIRLTVALIALLLFFWDGARIWGWRLQLLPESLNVRRYFRWTSIPWTTVQSVESIDVGRRQERVVLMLKSNAAESLGTFFDIFARNLRARLRHELAQKSR